MSAAEADAFGAATVAVSALCRGIRDDRRGRHRRHGRGLAREIGGTTRGPRARAFGHEDDTLGAFRQILAMHARRIEIDVQDLGEHLADSAALGAERLLLRHELEQDHPERPHVASKVDVLGCLDCSGDMYWFVPRT